MGAILRDYDRDDPVYSEEPQRYSPHWVRTLIEPKKPSPAKPETQQPSPATKTSQK
jgi:hypothetical protein